MEFSRSEYCSGWPFPSPGDLPNPGIEHRSSTLQADSLPAEPPGKPRVLEWVAHAFSSWSSRPRDRTGVSCIVGGFFTSWAVREAHRYWGPAQLIGLPRWFSGKDSACQGRKHRFDPWVSKVPWSRKWPPTPVFLLEKSPGQRSLTGYSSWGCKELDITEHTWTQWYSISLTFVFFLLLIR